jgi:hypothetical protein
MKISARAAAIFAIVFSIACFAFALTGFMSLSEIADPVQQRDARGFAWFWVFLGSVGVVFGGLSWWITGSGNERK